ncbi:ADP-ribosylation factor-like protein 16 isoform X1 [Cynocephalus volans]|uniref:ADP-ribosylation factor-like protein 16 isoform X1 n=1 Tax=Cynocephalus volans TaxID=110931 RepID=UPI002FC716F2
MCLLLGATGVGKTLLVKRLQQLSSCDRKGELGTPPATRPTVGADLTDVAARKKVTVRELGGCMGPIWRSYCGDCRALLFMIDASNPTQLSASCVQLLGLLSAEQLSEASVLILFNKISGGRNSKGKVSAGLVPSGDSEQNLCVAYISWLAAGLGVAWLVAAEVQSCPHLPMLFSPFVSLCPKDIHRWKSRMILNYICKHSFLKSPWVFQGLHLGVSFGGHCSTYNN